MARLIKAGGRQFLIQNGVATPVLATRSYAVAVAPSAPAKVRLPAAQLDALKKKLEAEVGGVAAASVLEGFEARPARTGTTVRAARAAGAGGECPYFGQEYVTTEGIRHPADCGFNRDGKFARIGDAAKGSGYLGHIAWASKR